MRIRLGCHLDGQHGEVVASQLDEITTGPLGMLNILETQLGLLHDETPHAERVLQYRDCLKRLDNVHRFYHKSFHTDELGTSATLLAWRDQWYLHGWRGPQGCSPELSESRRLRDMLDVEFFAVEKVAASLGERLASVAVEIERRRPRIARVSLCDTLRTWPLGWQRVLQVLPLHDPGADTPLLAASDATTQLGQLQTALLSLAQGKPPKKLDWDDDGSVRIVQAETRLLAARWLSDRLAREAGDTLLLAPEANGLDEVVAAANLPRQGFKENSAFRPALQVVPLVLGQLWKPLDLYGLLKFLTHPICPVPGVARTRLAEMLANSPGIGGGEAWERTLADIRRACDESGYDWDMAREKIKIWVEHPRYEPATGAPIGAIVDRLQQLANYFKGRLLDADPTKQVAFASGQAQTLACQRLLNALALQGETSIGPQQLQTLLDQATAQGSSNPLLEPQVGACRTITHPGAAVDTADHVVWWQLAAPSLPLPWPWSLSEQKALRAAGIALPEVAELLDHQSSCWQKPLLAARRSLTLVLPPLETEAHPVWLLLESLFEKKRRPAVNTLETLLTEPTLELQAHRPLPTRKRWWQLPETVAIPKREKESYSSLESFLFNPYQWVLTYPAALRPSSILDVSDGFLLYGNLAHHLIEQYVLRPDALTQSEGEFQLWFEPAFDTLAANEGAVLLMPGRREDLESLRRKLREAMLQLRRHWQSANIVRIEPEVSLKGIFAGGRIDGYGDLLLTRGDGEQAIVDMKWSGGNKYPEKLANNRHLQLAIYGELQRQKTGRWPKLAYFLIDSATLLATDRDFFPNVRQVWKKKEVGDEGAAHLWERFIKTWQWRRDQLDHGLIEVALSESGDTHPPEDGIALEMLNPAYNKYLALAGWGEEQ